MKGYKGWGAGELGAGELGAGNGCRVQVTGYRQLNSKVMDRCLQPETCNLQHIYNLPTLPNAAISGLPE